MAAPGGVFHILWINAFEEVILRRQIASNNRQLRDASDPFAISDAKFRKLYHIPKVLVLDVLIPMIEPHIQRIGIKVTYIPLHLKVLVTLHQLAQGSYQSSLGSDSSIAMSQSSVSRSLQEIVEVIGIHVFPQVVKFPTQQQKIAIKRGFLEKFQFPNTVGAIDCTHCAIIAPPEDNLDNPGIAYLNRKGYHSINVQAICDSQLKLLAVNARYPGSVHDAAIWAVSNINTYMARCFQQGEHNSWLIGDSGYPLTPWLMTPIPDAIAHTPEARYTQMHCTARNVIERCFGVLKQRFRCLLKHRVLHYSHRMAGLIIYSCAVLHNLCIDHNYYEEFVPDDDDAIYPYIDNENDAPPIDRNVLAAGRQARNRLIRALNN